MRCHIRRPILNEENSFKSNILLMAIGLLVMVVSSIIYCLNYTSFSECVKEISNADFRGISLAMGFPMIFVIGLVLAISSLNLHNPYIFCVLVFLLGVFTCELIHSEKVLFAFAMLIISIALFILFKAFEKVVCTFVTFSICSFSIILFYLLINLIPNMSHEVKLYCSISIFVLLYNILGRLINRCFLRFMFGHSKENANEYGFSQLKNQINIIYLFAFVIINIGFMDSLFSTENPYASVVNNALLTGVCISNVKWQSILWFVKDDDNDNNKNIVVIGNKQ